MIVCGYSFLIYTLLVFRATTFRSLSITSAAQPSSQVRRVLEVLEADEVVLHAARANKAVEDADATGLVVGAASTRAAERLLADDSACALLVVVHVAGGVAQLVARLDERLAVGGEARRRISSVNGLVG